MCETPLRRSIDCTNFRRDNDSHIEEGSVTPAKAEVYWRFPDCDHPGRLRLPPSLKGGVFCPAGFGRRAFWIASPCFHRGRNDGDCSGYCDFAQRDDGVAYLLRHCEHRVSGAKQSRANSTGAAVSMTRRKRHLSGWFPPAFTGVAMTAGWILRLRAA